MRDTESAKFTELLADTKSIEILPFFWYTDKE